MPIFTLLLCVLTTIVFFFVLYPLRDRKLRKNYGNENDHAADDLSRLHPFTQNQDAAQHAKDRLHIINYAKFHDKGHVKGILMTTWCGSGDLAKHLLYGEKGRWLHTDEIASTIDEIFKKERL